MNHLKSCTAPENCWCEIKTYSWVFLFGLFIFAIEATTGVFAESLALLADAGHVLSDNGTYLVAITISYLVRKSGNKTLYRYGGWVAIAMLFLVAALIVLEAVDRLMHLDHYAVRGVPMLTVATIGGWLNRIQHRMLHDLDSDHEMHAAITFHAHSDWVQSVAVVIGGIVITATGWNVVDSILSLGIAYWMAKRTVEILKNTRGSPPKAAHTYGHHH